MPNNIKKDNIVVISSIIIAIGLILIFFYYTYSSSFSEEPIRWFHSAGFIGGVVGTLLSAVGVYFAIQSLKISQEISRESSKLQEKIAEHMYVAMPSVKLDSNSQLVKCKLINVGNSPLRIDDIQFIDQYGNKTQVLNLLEELNLFINSQALESITLEQKLELAPSEYILLFHIKTNTLFKEENLKEVCNLLSKYEVEITYKSGLKLGTKTYLKSLDHFRLRS